MWFDDANEVERLERAVEDLAGLLLGSRPTFAIPWTDGENAAPVQDVEAVLRQVSRD